MVRYGISSRISTRPKSISCAKCCLLIIQARLAAMSFSVQRRSMDPSQNGQVGLSRFPSYFFALSPISATRRMALGRPGNVKARGVARLARPPQKVFTIDVMFTTRQTLTQESEIALSFNELPLRLGACGEFSDYGLEGFGRSSGWPGLACRRQARGSHPNI
jgi:hypothetical protein